jgi:hypothetical protein
MTMLQIIFGGLFAIITFCAATSFETAKSNIQSWRRRKPITGPVCTTFLVAPMKRDTKDLGIRGMRDR